MEDRIARFISALRNEGVRISIAESLDAFLAVQTIGTMEREQFKLSLQATLVKERASQSHFDRLFPLFFGLEGNTSGWDIRSELTDEEAALLADIVDELSSALKERLDQLLDGQELNPDQLKNLAVRLGIEQASDLKYMGWLVKRLEQALQLDTLRSSLLEFLQSLSGQQDQSRRDLLAQGISQNLQVWQEQIRHFIGQYLIQNLSDTPPKSSNPDLLDRPFASLTEDDMRQLRLEVRRLAAILRSRLVLRMKRAKKGHMDPKATIRANLKNNGIPIRILRRAKLKRPKVVALCDVSTSMRYCSELMLTLLYLVYDLMSKTHAFGFIDHLEYISPEFGSKSVEEAVGLVLKRLPAGYYSTDLGRSLQDFDAGFMDTINGATTLIIVGDGRNNYNNPRTDIFDKISRRANRTIWINPEPSAMWSSGDSDMLKYLPFCDDVLRAATLRQLSTAMDELIR